MIILFICALFYSRCNYFLFHEYHDMKLKFIFHGRTQNIHDFYFSGTSEFAQLIFGHISFESLGFQLVRIRL